MDEKSWHGVREHLVWEFWVILLTMEPPSQSKTLVQIESKSADKVLDVDNCSKPCFEEMLGGCGGGWGWGWFGAIERKDDDDL